MRLAFLLSIPLLLASCKTDQAIAQPATGPLDVSRTGVTLKPEGEEVLRAAAGIARCPCGGDHTLDQCLRTHTTCHMGPRALSLAAKLVNMGASVADLEKELASYRASFFDARSSFDVEEAACKGPKDAKVTVVEFSDFECPACANARLWLESLPEANGGMRLCFKHFPLKRHLRAFDAAQAAEFALSKGRFWDYHDLLFDGQASLEMADLKKYARIIGLDDAALERAVFANAYSEQVQASRAAGEAAGVKATPSLYINGRPLTLPMDADLVAHSVQDELVYQADSGRH